ALDRLIGSQDLMSGRQKQIASLLGDEDLAVAGKAPMALGRRGTPAFPALTETLASGSPQKRWGATVALYQSTADPGPFLREMTQQLADHDDALALASLGVLAHLKSRAAPALPAMKPLLKREEAEIRRATL